LAQNVADEIREAEEKARVTVKEAKAESARMIASARSEAEERIKRARQESHRHFREEIAKTEEMAEQKAAGVLSKGRDDARELESKLQAKIKPVAEWIAEEVMSRYGGNKD